jgi:hypothetical protein
VQRAASTGRSRTGSCPCPCPCRAFGRGHGSLLQCSSTSVRARWLRSLLTQGVASGPELTASVPTLVLALPVVVAACRVAAVVNLPAAASAHAPQTSGPMRTHAGRCPPHSTECAGAAVRSSCSATLLPRARHPTPPQCRALPGVGAAARCDVAAPQRGALPGGARERGGT